MRVLVVSPKFHPVVGGGETFALDAVEQLHSKSVTIAVAAEPSLSAILRPISTLSTKLMA